MQIVNNVQINGWSCSPKHVPAHFTVLKHFLVRIVWSFSKTIKVMAEPCLSKHGPVPFTMLKNFFVWIICSHLNSFKFMAGPRSPASPATAQLISRRERCFSSWSYAQRQQTSNQRLVVLPQSRSSSFHGVQQSFRLDGMKLFKKNIHFCGWAVLPQTRPSSIHGHVTAQFMPCHGPVHPMSRPSSFRGVKESFGRDIMQIVNNVQINGGSCSLKHGPTHFTVLKTFLVWMVWSFSKTFDIMTGPCSPTHGPVLFTVLRISFDVEQIVNNVQTNG